MHDPVKQTMNNSWTSCSLMYPATFDSEGDRCVVLPMSQGNLVSNWHVIVTLVCCIMLPAPSTIVVSTTVTVVLQAKQGVLPGVVAGKEVHVRLSLCIGFPIYKVRSAPAPEGA